MYFSSLYGNFIPPAGNLSQTTAPRFVYVHYIPPRSASVSNVPQAGWRWQKLRVSHGMWIDNTLGGSAESGPKVYPPFPLRKFDG